MSASPIKQTASTRSKRKREEEPQRAAEEAKRSKVEVVDVPTPEKPLDEKAKPLQPAAASLPVGYDGWVHKQYQDVMRRRYQEYWQDYLKPDKDPEPTFRACEIKALLGRYEIQPELLTLSPTSHVEFQVSFGWQQPGLADDDGEGEAKSESAPIPLHVAVQFKPARSTSLTITSPSQVWIAPAHYSEASDSSSEFGPRIGGMLSSLEKEWNPHSQEDDGDHPFADIGTPEYEELQILISLVKRAFYGVPMMKSYLLDDGALVSMTDRSDVVISAQKKMKDLGIEFCDELRDEVIALMHSE